MDIIGKIEINDSSSCVFYIEEFRGKRFGSIRKFVDSEVYEGPTKSGVVLNEKGVAELISLLENFSSSRGESEKIEDGKLGKVEMDSHNKMGEERCIVVQISTFKNEQALDIREYVETEAYSGPTKKGVRIPLNSIKDVIGYLKTMEGELKA